MKHTYLSRAVTVSRDSLQKIVEESVAAETQVQPNPLEGEIQQLMWPLVAATVLDTLMKGLFGGAGDPVTIRGEDFAWIAQAALRETVGVIGAKGSEYESSHECPYGTRYTRLMLVGAAVQLLLTTEDKLFGAEPGRKEADCHA